jgi:hypothetical protein
MGRFLIAALALGVVALGAGPLLAARDDTAPIPLIGAEKPVFLGSMTVAATPLPARETRHRP